MIKPPPSLFFSKNIKHCIFILFYFSFFLLLSSSQLKKPSLRTAKSTIYMQGALSKQLAPNLEKKISDCIKKKKHFL